MNSQNEDKTINVKVIYNPIQKINSQKNDYHSDSTEDDPAIAILNGSVMWLWD